ncbi:hypothetical protein [Bartonella massiliensis]|uniref:hypothetical protein n=1 Tax=Bartonella massiliensis TaxID=929795 RepID=UPI001158847F|nr:hypothetical protein [Bartonella massiliensis]
MFRLVLCSLLLFPFLSYAQEIKQETDNPSLTLPLIANYPLTEDFLLKLEKVEKECKILLPEIKNNPINYDSSTHSSIENYTAHIFNKPKLMDILEKNNLKPRDFATGNLALIEISMLLTFVPEKEYSYEKNIIFLNNLEFVKKHFYKITTILGNCEEFMFRN